MKRMKYKVGSHSRLSKVLAVLIFLFMITQVLAIFGNVPGSRLMAFQVGPFDGAILLHEILLIISGYLLLFLIDAAYLCRKRKRELVA